MDAFTDELPREVFEVRRAAFRDALGGGSAVLFAGAAAPRNYPANRYPFRASSHFLHLVGRPIEGAAVLVDLAGETLFVPRPGIEDALWHGPGTSRPALESLLGLRVEWLEHLPAALQGRRAATRPALDVDTRKLQSELLGDDAGRGEHAEALARALVRCRLHHDDHAIAQLRRAAEATATAHAIGMATARPGRSTSEVCAAMEAVFTARGMTTAYPSIVTPHGEVLHAPLEHRMLRHGDHLLCDVGAETASGYAADVTRTYPVSGRFDGVARELYQVVLAAQREAIHATRPGMRFRVVHLTAMRAMAEGLVAMGVLHGDVDERVADGSVALFFPHGVGHLLGLDVHDMEDLGDLAGYPDGRSRSSAEGLRHLRLDRDLEPRMLVTIEPGVYFVPGLIDAPENRRAFADRVDFAMVDALRFVRGIRIEDDVLVTEAGPRVLTDRAPKAPESLEQWIGIGQEAHALLGLEGP